MVKRIFDLFQDNKNQRKIQPIFLTRGYELRFCRDCQQTTEHRPSRLFIGSNIRYKSQCLECHLEETLGGI